MVKEYKLKKKYPSLPKNWEVGMTVGQGDRTATFADYSPCNIKYGSYRISCFEVQDNPEFWEEVDDSVELLEEAAKRYPKGTRYIAANRVEYIEKEFTEGISTGKFTVVEYTNFDGTKMFHITSKNNKSVYLNGVWAEVVKEKEYEILVISLQRSERPELRSVVGYGEDYILSLLKCQGNTIHSIKRLSDGEVFTLGDKVNLTDNYYWNGRVYLNVESGGWNNSIYPACIRNFKLIPEGLLIVLETAYGQLIQHVEKAKQPLFVTFDGKEIFINDSFYYIGDSLNICLTKSLFKGDGDFSKFKTFSTKEAAERWLEFNKPIYSKQFIIDKLHDPSSSFWQEAYNKFK